MSVIMLDDFVKETNNKASLIKNEFDIYRDYQVNNPWIVNQMITDIKTTSPQPDVDNFTFESIVSFKEEYFINDYSKVYLQVSKRNPLLIKTNRDIVLFYAVDENLFNKQIKAGFSLGDRDDNGRIVTGSNLVLNSIQIDLDEFLYVYYTENN